ncbi:hypothetical protein K458DRAFT_16591 [Lentithecium fluviatile CBS 122367]|uniref:Uncharacterized protein n=1 Tax=Lentithecium fluviatile CBS 122367 TaxID=1168545 RepID=A0A6G1J5E3_9PLEO|nr:hypothetical protein K458DRAFT_16591 [Lentithecium fluviatile CBS 122367]
MPASGNGGAPFGQSEPRLRLSRYTRTGNRPRRPIINSSLSRRHFPFLFTLLPPLHPQHAGPSFGPIPPSDPLSRGIFLRPSRPRRKSQNCPADGARILHFMFHPAHLQLQSMLKFPLLDNSLLDSCPQRIHSPLPSSPPPRPNFLLHQLRSMEGCAPPPFSLLRGMV